MALAATRRAHGARHGGVHANVVVHAFFIGLAVLILFPFYFMLIGSTRTTADLFAFPPYLTPGTRFIANFQQLAATLPFVRSFFNSLFIASVHTVLVLFFCSLAGFGFAKYTFPGRDRLFFLLLATMMIPGAISLVPWYVMMSKFGWVNDYRALIIPGIANAFGIFWMRQYIAGSIPDEMLQAGRIDGCGDFGLYARLVVPLIRPGLGTLALLTFLGSWNEFLTALIILKDPAKFTLPVILALLQNQYGNNLNLIMAGATLATMPIIVVFILMSRQFISGLTAGAVKA
jgi:ABC-type glycerol-3-phosphate transport system permease component